MTKRFIHHACSTVSVLAVACSTPVFAQVTPGDQSGTATAAGAGQSAVTSTNAPATDQASSSAARTRAAARDTGGSGDIIVTARRVEERLQDVPISITVFNQAQLASRNIVNAQDLATYTPSLSANTLFGSINTAFAIRGFVQDPGTQPSVGVYFADVVSPRSASTNIPAGDGAGPGSFFDLQNVQILKGPQGTLFGRNTTGGAVLLVPQKPTSKTEGYVEASYGNYDMKRIQGVFNTPLGDSARFRIAVDHNQRDGYIHNVGGIGPSRFDDVDYTAVRASLVVDLTPDIENYTIASYLRSDTNGDIQALYTCNPSKDFANILGLAGCDQLSRQQAAGKGFYSAATTYADPNTKETQWQIINTTTWRASDDLTIKNIVSYAQFVEDFGTPIFGTQLNLHNGLALTGLPDAFNPFAANEVVALTQSTPKTNYHTADQDTFTEELQAQGSSFDGKLKYQGGAYLEVSSPLGETAGVSPELLDCSNVQAHICSAPIGGEIITTMSRTEFHNVGLYSQATYSFTDKLSLTGGIRYTWDRVNTGANLTNLIYPMSFVQSPPAAPNCAVEGTTPAPDCFVRIHEKSQAPTWLVDLDYKPVNDVLIYAKYARGYRAGGITANVPAQFQTFGPEHVDSYEGGIKTSFRGPVKGTFNVAGFYNSFRDQQLFTSFAEIANPTNITSGILNAGKSRLWGIEVEGSVTPFRGFTLDASYSYLNTKLLRVQFPTSSGAYDLLAQAQPGDPSRLTPKNQVSATASYALPLDPGIGKVAVSTTFTHIDKQVASYEIRDANGNLTPYDYLQKRNLLDANITWSSIFGTQIDASVFGTNLTDKHYYTYISGYLPLTGFDTASLGLPRMYGGRLRYHF